MNCFVHERTAAVGLCSLCQRAVCRECVGRDAPRIVCRTCVERRPIMGFEYRSSATIAGWPLIHACAGVDPVTMRPRVAKGVIAIGNVAIGGIAVAGAACGLVTLGGVSVGLLLALGGAALGTGLSVGGLAVGSVAFGGAAIGFIYANRRWSLRSRGHRRIPVRRRCGRFHHPVARLASIAPELPITVL